MMQYLTPKTSIKGINEAALRSSSAQAVAEIMFVKICLLYTSPSPRD